MKNNLNDNRKNLEQKILEQKEEIKKLQNENHGKNKGRFKNKDTNEKLSYENAINSYKIENLKLKKILCEKEKIIENFQKVSSDVKKKIESLLLENKKLFQENQIMKKKLVKYKLMKEKKNQEKEKEMLDKVKNLKDELNKIENYYITQLKENENEDRTLEKKNSNSSLVEINDNYLKQSLSSRFINRKNLEFNQPDYLKERYLNNNNINIGNFHNRKKSVSIKKNNFINIDSSNSYNNISSNNHNNSNNNIYGNTNNNISNYNNNNFNNNLITNILFSKNGRNTLLDNNNNNFNLTGNIYYNPIQTNNYINKLRNQFSPTDIHNKTSEIYDKYAYN
jgi:hypothetical protein